MKSVKILRGPHSGKRGRLLKTEGNEGTILIDGGEETVKVPIDWFKILGFLADLFSLISSLFKK